MSDEYKTIWTSSTTNVEKKWGFEQVLGSLSTITAKVLYLDAGKSTSLKYYKNKSEVLFLRKGKINLEYDSEKYHWMPECRELKQKVLIEGDIIYVQSMCPYKITAVSDSEIIEIGDNRHDSPVKIEET